MDGPRLCSLSLRMRFCLQAYLPRASRMSTWEARPQVEPCGVSSSPSRHLRPGLTMEPLRIVLADDHAIVRQGLRSLLEQQPGWKVVAEAVTGNEAVIKVGEFK